MAKQDRIDELSSRYRISFRQEDLDGMAERLRSATEAEYKDLKSFYLGTHARNRKVSPEEFEASMRKHNSRGDSFRYYKKPEPETEPTMAHLNLFALFKECGRDYDKLYDALMACSPEQLAYAARAGKVQATPEALVLHVYNNRASWGTAEPATAYSRTSGFTYKETSMQPENHKDNSMNHKDNLLSQYRLLSANPAYWEIDMSLVDLKQAAAIIKSALVYGMLPVVPVVTRVKTEGFRSIYKVHSQHTVLYAATKLYKLGGSLEGQAKIEHYEKFEHLMCLLLNDEVKPGVPAFDEVQSDEWIAGLLEPYQA